MTIVATFTNLCPGCFADKGNASLCAHCGYDESLKRGPLVLPHRSLLHNGQYLIGKVLGKPGGFGITYLAFDTKLETKVAIKEYLPRDLAGRDGDHATISAHSADDAEHFRYGLTQFLQEARTLARFDHANIVRVRNFFEENGTGYLVMDYYDGITLADYLAQQPQGKLPEKTAIDILMPILDGLREVHAKNFLHRDIKPQNIYLTTSNRAILLDFGAARQAMSERSRSLSVVLSEGYAPYEQYHRRGEQGPWTDIYASAAVLYHAVAGEPPPPATERVAKDELNIAELGVSASLSNALRLGLEVNHKSRPQTMLAFQGLLLGDLVPPFLPDVVERIPVKAVLPTVMKEISRPVTPPVRGFGFMWASIVVLIGVIWFVVDIGGTVPAPTGDAPLTVATVIKTDPESKPDKPQIKSGSLTYSIEKTGTYSERSERLIVRFNDRRLEGPEGEEGASIFAQHDFNDDGVIDALVSIELGGNGGLSQCFFVTVLNNKIVEADVECGQVIEEKGRFLVKNEGQINKDTIDFWGFDGIKAIKVRSIAKPRTGLAALPEFRLQMWHSNNTESLVADLDLDGKSDRIVCKIWPKEGVATSCTLPLPGGKTQDLSVRACNRVGVLGTQSNGFRELVCNDNILIRFDGHLWVESTITKATQTSKCKVNDPDISDSYVGDCKNGLAHGQGIAKGRDEYRGTFSEGYQDGFGIYLWGDDSPWPTERYEGWWNKGERKNVFGVRSVEIDSNHPGASSFKRSGKVEGNRYVVRGLWNETDLVRLCNVKQDCAN